jgi:hypothetical protein
MLLLVVVVLVGVLTGVARNERKRRALDASTAHLVVDAGGICRTLGDGREEGVQWVSLREVEVLVTAREPVLVLTGIGDDGCLVPVRLAAEHGVVERLHELPGFDGGAFRRGLTAPPQTRTTCWRRS